MFERKILFALPISIDQSLQIISNIRSFEKTNSHNRSQGWPDFRSTSQAIHSELSRASNPIYAFVWSVMSPLLGEAPKD